jgi:hypothetical protein
MKKEYTQEFVEWLHKGNWIEQLTPEENRLLANFLKTSMAKQRKRVALVEEVKDGVVYALYKVRYVKQNDVLELVVPGELYVHKAGEDLPKEVDNVPKLAFSTLYCLGETQHE